MTGDKSGQADLAETIASTRQDVALARDLHADMLRINLDLLTRLLDAAEVGLRADEVVAATNDRAREAAEELAKFRAEQARDAALEEAAALVEKYRHSSAEFIAAHVRALRGAA